MSDIEASETRDRRPVIPPIPGLSPDDQAVLDVLVEAAVQARSWAVSLRAVDMCERLGWLQVGAPRSERHQAVMRLDAATWRLRHRLLITPKRPKYVRGETFPALVWHIDRQAIKDALGS